MVEEMGVDRYMEEFLRVVDQNEMTDDDFRSFLRKREHPEEEAKNVMKGLKDIIVYSGPHFRLIASRAYLLKPAPKEQGFQR